MSKDTSPKFQGFHESTGSDYHAFTFQWLDTLAQIDTFAEFKVVQYILWHTWADSKHDGKPKVITTDEFMHGLKRVDGSRIDKGTGLSNHSVIDALRCAEEHGYIVVSVDDSNPARVVKAYDILFALDRDDAEGR